MSTGNQETMQQVFDKFFVCIICGRTVAFCMILCCNNHKLLSSYWLIHWSIGVLFTGDTNMSRSSSGDASSLRPMTRHSSSGSRKILPQIPNNEPINIPPFLSPGGDASFQPFFLEYALMAE